MSENYERFRELYEHRWGLNQGDSDAKETPDYWDERAADFSAKAHSDGARNDALEFLRRFAWNPDESVLDVAAGPGTFAIPLAHLVRQVTVTDFSTAMLDHLLKQAVAERVANLEVIHGRWLDLPDPGRFDTVLCLNSLGVIATDSNHQPQLMKALTRLRDACLRRLIVLIPHADSHLNPTMRKLLDIEEVSIERRRIAVLYYAMVDCGMLPDLEILSRPFRWTFASPEEACQVMLRKAGLKEGPREFAAYLDSMLIRDPDGRFNLVYNVSQALFTWCRQP